MLPCPDASCARNQSVSGDVVHARNTARTAEQTEIALFWVEQSPEGFNRIARIIAEQRHLDAWDSARLLAVLQMGEFDSYATNFDSK